MSRTSSLAIALAGVITAAAVVSLQSDEAPRGVAAGADGSAALARFSEYQRSGRVADLEDAERLAARALSANPADVQAVEARARAAMSRHHFRQGLALANRAAALAPDRVAHRGIRADALIELGRYRRALPAVQRRMDLRPDLDSYARGSYAAELTGNLSAARELMNLAVEAAQPGGFAHKYMRVQQIQLLLRYGNRDAAAEIIARAAAEYPGDPEIAIARGRLAAARGHLGPARRQYLVGIRALPHADHLQELAEAEVALGQTSAAQRHLGRARVAYRVAAAAEDNAIERLNLIADWSRPTTGDVEAAYSARARRPSVLGDAMLGWVLARAGRCDEGARAARRSLRLGTLDPRMLARAAYAEACAGNAERARALARSASGAPPHLKTLIVDIARDGHLSTGAGPRR